ncbi:hypothetical protein QVD17_38688 [Tagetes erecta]|uniref:ULTRAPETALA1/2 SAND domain-containing protein n=1 Tax=Tagetes erecta TaxID=13708 RepID=A0AAD8JM86_TARER|nr:hypothetical protein QVD17_38688 [Tagetes erecta]
MVQYGRVGVCDQFLIFMFESAKNGSRFVTKKHDLKVDQYKAGRTTKLLVYDIVRCCTTCPDTHITIHGASLVAQSTETIFSNEELSPFATSITLRAPHHVEIKCHFPNKRLEGAWGILRISDDGTIKATCHCKQDCNRGFTCPAKFSKHASSSTNDWRTTLSVDEIKLGDTPFVKYYKGDEYVRPCHLVSHRGNVKTLRNGAPDDAMVALRISAAKVASIASV